MFVITDLSLNKIEKMNLKIKDISSREVTFAESPAGEAGTEDLAAGEALAPFVILADSPAPLSHDETVKTERSNFLAAWLCPPRPLALLWATTKSTTSFF